MNDLTTVTGTTARAGEPDGFDPLIPEAAPDGPATQLCRAAFNAILSGELPLVSKLATSTGASSQEVELLVGRAVIVDESGRVVAAHGLSAVPARQHRLTLRGRPFWTWCAIDALGIPAGLGEDAVAETTCQLCGTPVIVEFKAGSVVAASHPEARVWDAQRLEGRGTSGPPHCALMNLFCTADHLAEWRASHPGEQGQERDLDEVGELGRAEWGDSHTGCNCQEGAQDVLAITDDGSRDMRHLFDAELQYQDGLAPVCEPSDRGQFVGSGTGRMEGPYISGNVRWSNFEHVFADHCRLNVAGMIQTDDGAEIRFDSHGFAVPPAGAGAWNVASAVRFAVSDSRYRWLEAAPVIWMGEFDATTATARYRAYVTAEPRNNDEL